MFGGKKEGSRWRGMEERVSFHCDVEGILDRWNEACLPCLQSNRCAENAVIRKFHLARGLC